MRRPGQGEKNSQKYSVAAAAVRAAAKQSKLNHFTGENADYLPAEHQPMLPNATSNAAKMHIMDHNDLEVYYKKLPDVPPPPPVNGGKHLEGSAGGRWMVTSTSNGGGGHATVTSVPNDLHDRGSSTCGSDEDFKLFDNSCELHGDPYRGYPATFECPEIYRALDGVRYIAECTMREEESSKVIYSFLTRVCIRKSVNGEIRIFLGFYF